MTMMSVVSMYVFSFFFSHRNHAAVRRLANNVFQLDGRVVDAKAGPQLFVDFAQYRIAL
jgi:hypothetical protein